MKNEKIYYNRIRSFIKRLEDSYYLDKKDVKVGYIHSNTGPIPFETISSYEFSPIEVGETWGTLWDSAWFEIKGKLPEVGGEPGILFDIEAEGAVFRNGSPVQGLTHKHNSFVNHRKRLYLMDDRDVDGDEFRILIEAAGNEIFGSWGRDEFRLKEAFVISFDRELWEFYHDLLFFLNLYEAQGEGSVLKARIVGALNSVVNQYKTREDIDLCKSIINKLKDIGADPVSLNAVSIGHGHLDIAWLWPKSETRRKAGRTFSTAIKLINEYPGYIFGASQPLLYQWVKEDYPELYDSIKKEVKSGNWECQGAMWIEPDTNLPSGESLIRQCYWGLKFYKDEFDVSVDNLWLPDVFGYCGSLPGILKGCGIESFLTTKLAWSETNKFPYDSFRWIGIDGSEVVTHLPPGKEYHTENIPKQINFAQSEYSEKGIHGEFINLFGIGDGGGGPSRRHIEYGLRSKNQNGVAKIKYESSSAFFKRLIAIKEELPKWKGELYLEFHRGTYTSVSELKRLNRKFEIALRDLEFLESLFSSQDLSGIFENLWKTLLENQFHDILPGSSIEIVNREAICDLSDGLKRIEELKNSVIGEKFKLLDIESNKKLLINTLSFDREELITYGEEPCTREFRIKVPAMGYKIVDLKKIEEAKGSVSGDILTLENSLVKYKLDPHSGQISSILIKEKGEEVVSFANRLLLWDDEPPRWDAWDISHYYREGEAQEAELVDRSLDYISSNYIVINQTLKVGNSTIIQELRLNEGETLLRVKSQIDWREERKLLRVESLTTINSSEATFEIPYGSIKRGTLNNNSWERAQFEVPGQRFANISNSSFGLSLISDSKYGYSSKEGTLDLSLLRSPMNPDKTGDRGVHTMVYAYHPHHGVFEDSDSIERAHSLNNPLIIRSVSEKPAEESYFSVDNGIRIEVVKKSFNRESTIIRLYETRGLKRDSSLKIYIDHQSVTLCDHLENEKLELKGKKEGEVDLLFTPFEIKTLSIS